MNNKENLEADAIEIEDGEDEPMTLEGLLGFFLEDVLTDESPKSLADAFFAEFVELKRPETAQILVILDLPDEALFQLLAQRQAQMMATLMEKAPEYLIELREIIAQRLTGNARNG